VQADNVRSVFAIDIDNDGDMDVLSANRDDDNIAWYENNGSQVFSDRVITDQATNAFSVFAIDIDNDGDVDVLSASDRGVTLHERENTPSIRIVTSVSQTFAGGIQATDPDGDNVTLAISGGTDSALFNLRFFSPDLSNGVLFFNTRPDFDSPLDDNMDNVYNLTVSATDGIATTTIPVVVTVTR
jgi:hypothetical protein